MSLKVLKQQLKDFVVEEKPEETKKEKKRKRALAEEKFTRARKVMKKNTVIIVHDINTYRYHQKVELLMNSNEYKVLLEVTNSSSPFGFAIVGRR